MHKYICCVALVLLAACSSKPARELKPPSLVDASPIIEYPRAAVIPRALSYREVLDYALAHNSEILLHRRLISIEQGGGLLERIDADASLMQAVTGIVPVGADMSAEQEVAPIPKPDGWYGYLTQVWNVLDFGISYQERQQRYNDYKIATLNHIRIKQLIEYRVTQVYWRCVAWQRAKTAMEAIRDPLLLVQNAAVNASQASIDELRLQRYGLTQYADFSEQYRSLSACPYELAKLMGLPPQSQPKVLDTNNLAQVLPAYNFNALITAAVQNRPEMQITVFQGKNAQINSRKALLKLLPGLELRAPIMGGQQGKDHYHNWLDVGLSLSWNGLNVLNAKRLLDDSANERDLQDLRNFSKQLAVLAQIAVSLQRYELLMQDFRNLTALVKIEAQIDQDQLGAQLQLLRRRVQLVQLYGEIQAEQTRLQHTAGKHQVITYTETAEPDAALLLVGGATEKSGYWQKTQQWIGKRLGKQETGLPVEEAKADPVASYEAQMSGQLPAMAVSQTGQMLRLPPAPAANKSVARPASSARAPVKTTKPKAVSNRNVVNQVVGAGSSKAAFAIQIFASQDSDRVVRLVTRLKSYNLRQQKVSKKGQLWHVALYGDYPSYSAAKRELANLPKSLLNYQPWVRSL